MEFSSSQNMQSVQPQQVIQLDEIQFIVDSLNYPPFNEKLTLYSFDNMSPLELLQLVNNVYAEIDSRQKWAVGRIECPCA
jgi:hypothetical protein